MTLMQIQIKSRFEYSVSIDVWGWLIISVFILAAVSLCVFFMRGKRNSNNPEKKRMTTVNKGDLNALTVRARFAYGIMCIEKALATKGISDSLLRMVIDTAWKYVEEEKLSHWDNEIKEVMPWGILDPYPKEERDYKFVSQADAISLKNIYNAIPPFIVEMLDMVIFLGIDFLYTTRSEKDIADYWKDLFSLMKKNNIDFPEFLFDASISKEDRFGLAHSRDFYRKK